MNRGFCTHFDSESVIIRSPFGFSKEMILVSKGHFGVSEVLLGVFDVVVDRRSEVVLGLLGWVQGRLLQHEVPVVLVNLLSYVKGVEVRLDVSVLAQVGDWVVEFVTEILLWELVLVAA